MKQNARKAYNALKRIGAPVLDPDKGWGGHFAISAELYGRDNGYYDGHIDQAPDGMPWADYYEIVNYDNNFGYTFGVHPAIIKILEDNGLYCEWYNAAVMSVYDK